MSWTDRQSPSIYKPQENQDFSSCESHTRKSKKFTTHQYEHCILCTRSLRIPLYKAIRFSGIPRTPRISFLQPISALLGFVCSFLYLSPFPLGSFTSSANCTFFFFLSFFFSSTIMKRKHTNHLLTGMIGRVRRLRKANI